MDFLLAACLFYSEILAKQISSCFTSKLLQIRKLPQEMTRAFISSRVIIQIQLMVLLRIPPLACFQDLSRNAALPPLLVHFICNFSRNLLLLGIVVENRAAVLRADIRALAVLGRWVVHLVEKLEESAVLNLIRVVDDLERFGMSSPPAAYSPISRVVCVAANVSDACIVQP